ncbi:hypothetical protein ID866_9065 [Astraeus odoratus]|nr:hypothetical protein ID866_9065 [Astraeus odoratus]
MQGGRTEGMRGGKVEEEGGGGGMEGRGGPEEGRRGRAGSQGAEKGCGEAMQAQHGHPCGENIVQGPGLHVTGKGILQLVEDCWRDDMHQAQDDDEDMEVDNSFAVLAALMEEHRDALGALIIILSALLKEFKGYHYEQWDLQAHQVKGLKALQREVRKVNALKVKELEATTKGKERVVEPLEELEESSNKEDNIGGKGEVIRAAEGKSGDKGEATKGEGAESKGSDRDMEMGAAPSASVM